MLGQAGDTTRLRRSAARGQSEADVARGGTQGWFPLEDGAVLPWHPMLVPAGRWSGTTVAINHGEVNSCVWRKRFCEVRRNVVGLLINVACDYL